jgi:hypothetical protein
MVQGILLVLPASLERSDSSVPFVMSTQAITCARDTECGIASREIRLSMDRSHYPLSLRPLHVADEGPEEVQSRLDFQRSDNAPTAIWSPLRSILTDP